MRRFGLDMGKKIKELSTGMREKFSIAAALSHGADLIIMDEPSSGLDPVARGELMDIFSEIISDEEKSVIISTHITSDLDRTADFIVMIDNGRLVFKLPKDELLETHRIVKGALSALTDDLKRSLVSYKQSSLGFEGLTASPDRKRELVYEKPSIEDIMRFYTKNPKGAVKNA